MTLARLRAPLLGLMLCVGGRSVKRWQQIEKRLKRKASEHLKHRWLGGNPGKCQHLVSPLLLDQDRYHTIAALFPIKSIGDTVWRCRMTLQTRATRFLQWLHDDQSGWAEIVAGRSNPNDAKKIDLVMNTRRWRYLDFERPDLYDQASAYIDQLSAQY